MLFNRVFTVYYFIVLVVTGKHNIDLVIVSKYRDTAHKKYTLYPVNETIINVVPTKVLVLCTFHFICIGPGFAFNYYAPAERVTRDFGCKICLW